MAPRLPTAATEPVAHPLPRGGRFVGLLDPGCLVDGLHRGDVEIAAVRTLVEKDQR